MHVERGDRARGDERVAQPDVVDVGAEAHVLRGRRDRGQRHQRVERGRVRRDRRVRVAVVRAPVHLHREHEVLRQPHRLEPGVLGGLRGGRPELRVHPREHHTDLHGVENLRVLSRLFQSSSRGSRTMSIERFSLDGKVAIVTGGAGGCGEEYGRGLTAAGAQVVLADLDGEQAERVRGRAPRPGSRRHRRARRHHRPRRGRGDGAGRHRRVRRRRHPHQQRRAHVGDPDADRSSPSRSTGGSG